MEKTVRCGMTGKGRRSCYDSNKPTWCKHWCVILVQIIHKVYSGLLCVYKVCILLSTCYLTLVEAHLWKSWCPSIWMNPGRNFQLEHKLQQVQCLICCGCNYINWWHVVFLCCIRSAVWCDDWNWLMLFWGWIWRFLLADFPLGNHLDRGCDWTRSTSDYIKD